MIRNLYKTLLVITLTITFVNGSAQSDEEAIKQSVNALFNGMRQSDTTLIRSVFSNTAILQTIGRNKEGMTVIRTSPADSFIISIGRPHDLAYDERISFETIKIDGNLASVWTPYKFYLGEKFLHCGVNSFQMVKINGKWLIQYLIDTRRRENCD